MSKLPLDISQELTIKATRSSGSGGQNVNKVSTRVEVDWNIPSSTLINQEQKEILLSKLSGKLSKLGVLKITCQESRSQLENKEIAIKKIHQLIYKALIPETKRIATKPSKSSVEKKKLNKQHAAEKKSNRLQKRIKFYNSND